MALVNPNIAMSFRQPEFRPRNALAEYAQVQQIVGGQRQTEIADMQLQRMRQEDAEIERIHQLAKQYGAPESRLKMGQELFASRNPQQRELGYKIIQHEEAKAAFARAEQRFGYAPATAATGGAAATAPTSAAGAITGKTPTFPIAGKDVPMGTMGTGTFDTAQIGNIGLVAPQQPPVSAEDRAALVAAAGPSGLANAFRQPSQGPYTGLTLEQNRAYFQAPPEERAALERALPSMKIPGVFAGQVPPFSQLSRDLLSPETRAAQDLGYGPAAQVDQLAAAPAAQANALAPAASPANLNQLAAAGQPAAIGGLTGLGGKTLAQLQNEFRTYSFLDQQGAPGAKGRLEEIKREIDFIYKTNEPGAEEKLMRRLNIPFTEAGFAKLERLKQNPGEFTRLLEASGLPEADRTALIRKRLQKEATHAPATTVNVSTEKKYGERFGGLIAEQDAGKLSAAEKAPQLAASANRIIGLVQQGNVFTGPIADVKLNIARALNVAGASNQEKIANTENLIAATGQSTLDAIKNAGLGTGQGFTNKDLEFLRGIAGGTINLTPQTLTELARLQHLTATRSAESWNKRVREIPRDVIQGTGLSTTPITVPPLTEIKKGGAAAPTTPAPAGVDPAVWGAMTPQERSLWQK
jgi:hypothetical protein